MSKVARITISLERELLEQFDRRSRSDGFPTRSEAIKDAMRRRITEQEWAAGRSAAGAVAVVYDHHKPSIQRDLTRIQHDFTRTIISAHHVHLDHHNCLEFIAVRGRAREIEKLVRRLRSVKGLKHCRTLITAAGGSIH